MRTETLCREKSGRINAHQLSAALAHLKRAQHEEGRLAAGLTTNMIANIGKGEHISMKTLLRICGALECDISTVMELEQED